MLVERGTTRSEELLDRSATSIIAKGSKRRVLLLTRRFAPRWLRYFPLFTRSPAQAVLREALPDLLAHDPRGLVVTHTRWAVGDAVHVGHRLLVGVELLVIVVAVLNAILLLLQGGRLGKVGHVVAVVVGVVQT